MNRGLRLLALPLAGLIFVSATFAAVSTAAGTSGPPATSTDVHAREVKTP